MPVRILWFFSFLLTTVLLGYFFTYPFARLVLLPLALVLALVTWFYPAAGLALFMLTTLTTLQLPIILELPYFSGPEPGFLAVWATLSLRQLARPSSFELPATVKIALTTYVSVILVSALTVWLTLWDLPHPWLRILSFDALSKIYFWRWENPYHFLRISLLYLEGVAAFLITRHALKRDAVRNSNLVLYAFVTLGILLMGYSAVDLLFRHKPISVYPGYGAVFTDRNAYAAFWILFCPVSLAMGLSRHGLVRAGFLILFALGSLFCFASLSFTGLVAWLVAVLAIFALLPSALRTPFRPAFYGRHWPAISVLLIAVVLLSSSFTAELRSGAAKIWSGRPVKDTLDRRLLPWKSASAMFTDHPLIGIGVGEFYKNFPNYRTRFPDLPDFEYQRENAHNYFLQLAAETGILGIGSFLCLLFYVAAVAYKAIQSSRLAGEKWRLAGLLAALLGFFFFSLSQHPMLRGEFQIYFSIFAATLLTLSREKFSSKAASWRSIAAVIALVILTGLAQAHFFPLNRPTQFEYGFREWETKDGLTYRNAEAVAFLRAPLSLKAVSFRLRNASEITGQRARLLVNGKERYVTLEGGRWREIREEIPAGRRLEIGIFSDPAVPAGFSNSWGKGVQITEISR